MVICDSTKVARVLALHEPSRKVAQMSSARASMQVPGTTNRSSFWVVRLWFARKDDRLLHTMHDDE